MKMLTNKVGEGVSCMQAYMKSQILDCSYLTSIISVLTSFTVFSDSNKVHEIAATWLILYFIEKYPTAALNARLYWKAESSNYRVKEGISTAYC